MDSKAANEQLIWVRTQLAQLDKEREALAKIESGLVEWLNLQQPHPQPQLTPTAVKMDGPKISAAGHPYENKAKGSISMRAAIRQILAESPNQDIHTKEILDRARVMGAVTDAKNPLGVIDLNMARFLEIMPGLEKVRGRKWRFNQPTANAAGAARSIAG
ncbi:MAG: hypothetical protein C0506_12525 [Anaerolinea sp.]|nr:hypothetical protein [Anaerolinea sp.]